MPKMLEVVAGVLQRPDGSFLLASRPEGKAYAGYWEFPGGKIEAGEAPYAALVRELQEELAITVTAATPWLVQQFVYPHAHVHLRFYRISAWQGEPHAQEGQQLRWQHPGQLDVSPMLPANTPILRALSLPGLAALTCAGEIGQARILAALPAQLAHGLRLLLVREPGYTRAELASWVAQLAEHTRPAGCRLLVNADPDWLAGWPIDGVHLNSTRLAACRQRPDFAWVGASTHRVDELQHAATLGLDYALLGHVQPSASHPAQAPLGWEGLACQLAEAGPSLPVYALGGLDAADLARAHQQGAHGVALMRGAWA